MPQLLVFVLAGLVGQLVDGSLGMGFGVTSATVLLSTGITPAAASASIHLAKIGTALSSGASHWHFGNVSWPLVARIGVPGALGAFVGATVLSSLTGTWIVAGVAVVLFALGLVVIRRSVGGGLRGGGNHPSSVRTRLLAPLGLAGGFVDAIGGGGWGPVATPALLTAGRIEPRYVIGSVSAAEMLVTVAASAGFLVGLGHGGLDLGVVLALLGGGAVAAPLAAWLVKHLDPSVLGVVVGSLLLVTNARTLMVHAGVPGPARLPVLAAIAVVGAVVAGRVARQPRTPAEPAEVAVGDAAEAAEAAGATGARRLPAVEGSRIA